MMRVLKISFVWFALTLVLMGCGKGIPQISSPADGQTFKIDQTSAIDITLADNSYDGVTITFAGDLQRVPEFSWAPIQNTQGRVYRAQQQGFGGGAGAGGCTQRLPCTITIDVARGDQSKRINISLYY